MDINRRMFLGAGVAMAAAGLAKHVEAAGETVKFNGRSYVAACPPVTERIPRKPGPYRVMVVGAHPDDADIVCGCTAAKLVAKGAQVKFVACCNGSVGHHLLDRKATAAKRRQETLNAAKVWGLDSYDIYGWEDAGIPYTIEAREIIAGHIMDFEPDIVITHRDCDYHVDHRTVGKHVMDAGYMLGCPHWIAGKKALRRRPLIILMSDAFTTPREMRPDILVNADPYMDKWCEALNCQECQFYEWLAWDKGVEHEVAAIGDRSKNIAARNAYLLKYWSTRKLTDAKRFAGAWKQMYPGRPLPKRIEAYEISEYGRPPVQEDFDLLLD